MISFVSIKSPPPTVVIIFYHSLSSLTSNSLLLFDRQIFICQMMYRCAIWCFSLRSKWCCSTACRNDAMFASMCPQAHIISVSVIIGAANIICRRQTSFKNAPLSQDKSAFFVGKGTRFVSAQGAGIVKSAIYGIMIERQTQPGSQGNLLPSRVLRE